jgi:hypothetical protein
MAGQTVATKGQRVWHRLPPPNTIPFALAAGLYWLFALMSLASAGRYTALGMPPVRLWAELVGLPLLLGAQHLATGLGVWQAVVGWGRPATRASQRRALVAAAGAIITLGALVVAGCAVLALQPTTLAASWALALLVAVVVGGGHLALARGVRHARPWARIIAAIMAVAYLIVAFFVIMLILALLAQPSDVGPAYSLDPDDAPGNILIFIVVSLLINGASVLVLYGLNYDIWYFHQRSSRQAA